MILSLGCSDKLLKLLMFMFYFGFCPSLISFTMFVTVVIVSSLVCYPTFVNFNRKLTRFCIRHEIVTTNVYQNFYF